LIVFGNRIEHFFLYTLDVRLGVVSIDRSDGYTKWLGLSGRLASRLAGVGVEPFSVSFKHLVGEAS